jgi:hypothetical protein
MDLSRVAASGADKHSQALEFIAQDFGSCSWKCALREVNKALAQG